MNIKIVKSTALESTSWSGGTTTELFIYPENSSYSERNFDFRISTAEVQLESSDFTPLPGFFRKLMVLKGKIEISHENEHNINLSRFDQDEFSGDWKTSSIGKCTDFNFIHTQKFEGELLAKKIQRGEKLHIIPADSFTFLYLLEGQLTVELDKTAVTLNASDLIVIQGSDTDGLQLIAIENALVIETRVDYRY
jgi:environmental stress-induced protein Ves